MRSFQTEGARLLVCQRTCHVFPTDLSPGLPIYRTGFLTRAFSLLDQEQAKSGSQPHCRRPIWLTFAPRSIAMSPKACWQQLAANPRDKMKPSERKPPLACMRERWNKRRVKIRPFRNKIGREHV